MSTCRDAAARWARLLLLLIAAAAAGGVAPSTSARADDDESEAEKIAKEDAAKEAAAKASLAGDFKAATEEFRPKLRALGNWCSGADLLQSRARLAEALLVLDPDDASGREWLGWKRLKDGRWKPGPWRSVTDKQESLAEFATRRAPLAAAMREKLFPFLERCRDWTNAGLRDGIVRTLAAVFPDDAELRGMNGETLVKGKWVLKETAATQASRERITAAAAAARLAAAQVQQTVSHGSADGEWDTTLDTDRFRILSEVPVDETRRVASAMLAAQALHASLFGTEPKYPKHLRVYLLKDSESNARFAAYCTELSDADRKLYAGYASWWFPDSLVISRRVVTDKCDSAVRQMFSNMNSAVVRLNRAPPWISEGLGMYLTYRLLGTRNTVFIDSGDYLDDSISRDVAAVDADWVQISRRLVDKGYALDLPVITSLPLNSLTKDDGLIAYALAAYFAEGRPADLTALLGRLKGDDAGAFHQALAETCGIDAVGLQIRFVRWLHEIPAK